MSHLTNVLKEKQNIHTDPQSHSLRSKSKLNVDSNAKRTNTCIQHIQSRLASTSQYQSDANSTANDATETNLKAYAVVKFVQDDSSEEISTVPLKWTFFKNNISYCTWPSKSKDSKLHIKRLSDPQNSWKTYACQIIKTFVDFKSASKYEHQFASLEATDNENQPMGKGLRKIKPKIFSDFVGESSNSSDKDENVELFSFSDNDADNSNNLCQNDLINAEPISNTDFQGSQIVILNSRKEHAVITSQDIPINQNEHTCCQACQQELSILSRRIMEMNFQLQQMNANMENSPSGLWGNDNLNKLFNCMLPLNSIEQIKEVEKTLENSQERKKLRQVLRTIGGNNVSNFTRRCLSKLFTDEVSVNCSWTGAKGNFRIENLKLIAELKEMVKLMFPNGTNIQMENTTMDFFRYANQRVKNKNKNKED